MSEKLAVDSARLFSRLVAASRQDEALRSDLEAFARSLLEALDQSGASSQDAYQRLPRSVQPSESSFAARSARDSASSYASGNAGYSGSAVGSDGASFDAGRDGQARWPDIDEDELKIVEQRCRIKSEAARWVGTSSVSQDPETYDSLIRRAKGLPQCYLWMCQPVGRRVNSAEAWEEVAAAYDALADAVKLARDVVTKTEPPPETSEVLQLLATAQSCLRGLCEQYAGWNDPDQQRSFYWLRRQCEARRILVQRHMKLDDVATAEDFAEALKAVREARDRPASAVVAQPAAAASGTQPSEKPATGGSAVESSSGLASKVESLARRMSEQSEVEDADWDDLLDYLDEMLEVDDPALDDLRLRSLLRKLGPTLPKDIDAPTDVLKMFKPLRSSGSV